MGYGATYTTTAEEVLERFQLAMRMVGLEIYKVSMLLWMDNFVPLLGVCPMDRITVRLPKGLSTRNSSYAYG